jgi:hypothetical protein
MNNENIKSIFYIAFSIRKELPENLLRNDFKDIRLQLFSL